MTDRPQHKACHWCGLNVPELQKENAELRRLTNRHDHDYLAVTKEVQRLLIERDELRGLVRYLVPKILTLTEADYDRIKAVIGEGE